MKPRLRGEGDKVKGCSRSARRKQTWNKKGVKHCPARGGADKKRLTGAKHSRSSRAGAHGSRI